MIQDFKATLKTATAMVEYISSFSKGDAIAPIDKVDDGGGHNYDIMLMTIYEYVDINDDNDDDDGCCVAIAYSKWQTESDIMYCYDVRLL